MLNFIDSWLSKITMYRLVLYFLIVILLVAFVLSFFPGIMPFTPAALTFSVLVLLIVSWITNKIFAAVFKVPANVESVYITVFILSLIITPVISWSGFWFLFWASVISQAGKYILAWRAKHLFNPAALAVAVTMVSINQSASWWVGTAALLPVVIIGGLLVTRKIQRFDLVLSFLVTGLAAIIFFSYPLSGPVEVIQKVVRDSPFLFFSFIMQTEPMTTPPTRFWRVAYGVFVGLLFSPRVHFGSVYSTPELALLAGNIFAYIVSPKQKYLLKLKEKVSFGPQVYDFIFQTPRKLAFRPGQYFEWTLGHENSDSRGNRRYFTIASAPTEPEVHIGVKFYNPPSSFKRALLKMKRSETLLAGQVAGDFTLPNSMDQKLAFIAGGIGITPFRSMLKDMVDRGQQRDIVLFYSVNDEAEIAYRDVLDQAAAAGVKNNFIISTQQKLTAEYISRQAPDFEQRLFYISGPHGMVVAFEKTLRDMGVPRRQIKIDFFPGYA